MCEARAKGILGQCLNLRKQDVWPMLSCLVQLQTDINGETYSFHLLVYSGFNVPNMSYNVLLNFFVIPFLIGLYGAVLVFKIPVIMQIPLIILSVKFAPWPHDHILRIQSKFQSSIIFAMDLLMKRTFKDQFKRTFCSHLQIIKTVCPLKF